MTINVDRIQHLLDHNDIANLVTDVLRCLDTKMFEHMSHIYSADAVLDTPNGTIVGIEAIIDAARLNHEVYEQTQHLVAGITIDLSGDRAIVDANIVAVFVPTAGVPASNRMIGIRYAFEATRTTDGWRFTRLAITPVWER